MRRPILKAKLCSKSWFHELTPHNQLEQSWRAILQNPVTMMRHKHCQREVSPIQANERDGNARTSCPPISRQYLPLAKTRQNVSARGKKKMEWVEQSWENGSENKQAALSSSLLITFLWQKSSHFSSQFLFLKLWEMLKCNGIHRAAV